MPDKFWMDLREKCANCGEPYAMHGAPEPHQCPGKLVAGGWEVRDTHFKRANPQNSAGGEIAG